jgi:hypothetical protein
MSGRPRRGARRHSWLVATLVLTVSLLVSACGSSAGSGTTSSNVTPPSAASIAAACQRVSAALSDGPDPDADPVGYAEAQVLPLRQITTSDASLRRAIDRLAGAYETFFKDNGTKTAGAAVTAAGEQVDKICPGATS